MTLTNETPKPSIQHLTTLLDSAWLVLSRPWLALLVAVLLGLTILCALLLPQLPAQFANDPIAAARWTSSQSSDFGFLGSALAGLGLFNAMNGVLWRALTVALAFLFSVQLLHLWLLDRQIQMLTAAFTSPEGEAGTPIQLSAHVPIHRRRTVAPIVPEEKFVQVVDGCRSYFDEVQLSLPNEVEANNEHRCLAMGGRSSLHLRLVGVIGGLLMTLALWMLNSYGWRIETPALAPLDQFRDEWHQVQVNFDVEDGVPSLWVNQSGISNTLEIETDRIASMGNIRAIADTPALLIESLSPEAPLRRPEGASVTKLGLSFPTLGREETVSLSEQAAVLRIVRRAPTQQSSGEYSVEVILSDDQKSERFVIDKAETHPLRFAAQTIDLRFTPLASQVVRIHHLPGLWLLWPALALGAVGLVGLRRRPRFAIVQVAPWPSERSVVVIQSGEESLIEKLLAN